MYLNQKMILVGFSFCVAASIFLFVMKITMPLLDAVKDALSANRRVFVTGHNDGLYGVRQAPVELPMHALETRES